VVKLVVASCRGDDISSLGEAAGTAADSPSSFLSRSLALPGSVDLHFLLVTLFVVASL